MLAFVWLLSGDEKWREPARKYILDLAAWDPDGPTNFKLNCEAAKPLVHRLARVYDWGYGLLNGRGAGSSEADDPAPES